MHGFTDYSYVPLTFLAPVLAKFENDKASASICRLFAATVLGYSLITDAKWGVVKLLPYKVHAALDLLLGVLAFVAAAVPPVSRNKKAFNTLMLMS